MSDQVEEGDLDHFVSIGLIIRGKYRDVMKIRRVVREKVAMLEKARVIYGTISSFPLYVVQGDDWRRLKGLEKQLGGEKQT